MKLFRNSIFLLGVSICCAGSRMSRLPWSISSILILRDSIYSRSVLKLFRNSIFFVGVFSLRWLTFRAGLPRLYRLLDTGIVLFEICLETFSNSIFFVGVSIHCAAHVHELGYPGLYVYFGYFGIVLYSEICLETFSEFHFFCWGVSGRCAGSRSGAGLPWSG